MNKERRREAGVGPLACVSGVAGPHMGCGVPAGVWIITISILTYGICAVNRNDVPVWESLVPILCHVFVVYF